MFEFLYAFKWFQNQKENQLKAQILYKNIVAQSRSPYFYTNLNVHDSQKGRFELVALHLFLVLKRLKAENSFANDAKMISQFLTDQFVIDMDSSLRQIVRKEGKISKTLKQATQMLYGRVVAYDQAIENQDSYELNKVLCRNIYQIDQVPKSSKMLEILNTYVFKAWSILKTQTLNDLIEQESIVNIESIKDLLNTPNGKPISMAAEITINKNDLQKNDNTIKLKTIKTKKYPSKTTIKKKS